MFLDRHTRRNLELTESLRSGERKGSLLWLLDQTRTAMGARLLRTWVENPMVSRHRIQTRLDAVEALKDNFIVAEELGEKLETVADMERLLGKISYNSLTARDCLALNRSLNAIAPVKALLESVDVAPLNALAHTMAPLDSLCELLEKAISPDAPLTLQDISKICRAFTTVLKGVFHERIEYPSISPAAAARLAAHQPKGEEGREESQVEARELKRVTDVAEAEREAEEVLSEESVEPSEQEIEAAEEQAEKEELEESEKSAPVEEVKDGRERPSSEEQDQYED